MQKVSEQQASHLKRSALRDDTASHDPKGTEAGAEDDWREYVAMHYTDPSEGQESWSSERWKGALWHERDFK